MINALQVKNLLLTVGPAHSKLGFVKEQIYLKTMQLGKINDIEEKKALIKEIFELKAQTSNYRPVCLNFYGPSGAGKTHPIVKTFGEMGIPVIQLESSMMSDTIDTSGMLVKNESETGVITTEKTMPYFIPRPVLNEDGTQALREDGGLMWDYEAMGFKIKNYLDAKLYREGNLNQAPYAVLLCDDANKTPLNDVKLSHFGLLNIIDENVFNGEFVPNFLIIFTGNPDTSEYDTNGMFEDVSFANRVVSVRVNLDEDGIMEQAKEMNISYKGRKILSKMPQLAVPKESEESMSWKPARQSSLRTLTTFDYIINMFEDNPTAMEILLRGLYGEMADDILDYLKEGLNIPTGLDIITKFDDVEQDVMMFIETNEQGIINFMRDQVLDLLFMTKEDLQKIGFVHTGEDKDEDGKKVITEGLDNLAKFLKVVPNTIRLDIIMETLSHTASDSFKISRYLSRHPEIKRLTAQDMDNIRLAETGQSTKK